MTTRPAPELAARLKRWMIFLGVAQVTVGCIVGLVPPAATPWFRGIVMSHIEYTANGVLMIAFGFLTPSLVLGPTALRAWFVALQAGTWTNGTAGLVAALTGASSPNLPTLNEKFPPPHGANQPLVTGLLVACAVTMLGALGLTLVGLGRGLAASDSPRHNQ